MGGSVGGFFKNLGNSDVTDPNQANWGDLSGSEKGARVTSGITSTLGKGLQGLNAPQQQRAGGGAPIQVAPNPQLPNQFDPNYLSAWRNGFGGR